MINLLGGFGSGLLGVVHFMVYGKRRSPAQPADSVPDVPVASEPGGTLNGVEYAESVAPGPAGPAPDFAGSCDATIMGVRAGPEQAGVLVVRSGPDAG